MSGATKVELLRSIPLFARLSNHDLERVGQLADEIDVQEGRTLMRQGDAGREMFVIVSGRVNTERDGQLLAELGPGDWLGEMALLSEGDRMATATVMEPTRLLVVSHRDFHALMDEMDSVRVAVFQCVADRIAKLEPQAGL